MKLLSVVFPCFNESKNIPCILDRLDKIINRNDIEIILVDNGSTDETYNVLCQLIPNYPFAKIEKVDVNKGYGFGIKKGLKSAKGLYVGWTHADMQTDPNDLLRGLEIIESYKRDSKVFVKGKRTGRGFLDNFFTLGMSIFESTLLFAPLWDINAQPNIFHRDLLEFNNSSPDDFSFDLFYYFLALKKKYKLIRFKVEFNKRFYGKSKWNVNWNSRFKFIIRTILYSLKLLKKIKLRKEFKF